MLSLLCRFRPKCGSGRGQLACVKGVEAGLGMGEDGGLQIGIREEPIACQPYCLLPQPCLRPHSCLKHLRATAMPHVNMLQPVWI